MTSTTRLMPFFAALLVLTGAASREVEAQTTTTVAVSIPIASVLFLSSSGSFTFPAATDAHYTAGLIGTSTGPTLTHRANVPYQITINAQAAGSALGFANAVGRTDANPNKPLSDLQLRGTTSGTPGSMTGLGTTVSPTVMYSRATKGGTLTTAVDAQLTLSYATDPPGTYSTTVVFTIVAQ
jgi:hypothetical protein